MGGGGLTLTAPARSLGRWALPKAGMGGFLLLGSSTPPLRSAWESRGRASGRWSWGIPAPPRPSRGAPSGPNSNCGKTGCPRGRFNWWREDSDFSSTSRAPQGAAPAIPDAAGTLGGNLHGIPSGEP